MFSSRTLVSLFVYLSLLLAFAEAHDGPLLKRDHANLNMKRLMKKRSPLPDLGLPDLGQVADAAPLPSVSNSLSVSPTSGSPSTTPSAPPASVASSLSSAASNSASSASSASSSASSAASSASSNSTIASSSTPSAVLPSLNLVPIATPASVSTFTPTFTRTATATAAAQDTAAPTALSGLAKTKSTTSMVVIIVAASVGGIFILWTVFRKWKLSSSKKFDERLRPIDWQPTAGEDDVIPTHRRVPSGSSFHSAGHSSNSGHGNPGFGPLEHDFTAGPLHANNIGGYADLARSTSPNPGMQELARGPSFNRGYEQGVPLHHQTGYGDYNGGPPRY